MAIITTAARRRERKNMIPKNVQMPNPNPKYKPPGTPTGGRGGTLMEIGKLLEQLKIVTASLEHLRDDLEQARAEITGLKIYYDEMTSKEDCNTCNKLACTYRPSVGDTVRVNCPLWSGRKQHGGN